MMLVSELTEACLHVSFWQQTSVTTWQLCTIHSAKAAVFLLCKTVLARMQYSQWEVVSERHSNLMEKKNEIKYLQHKSQKDLPCQAWQVPPD